MNNFTAKNRFLAYAGDKDAQFSIALCYYEANGVKNNMSTAFKLFEKAANKEHIQAQFYLGLCYENGDGTSVNFEKAVEWYSVAANNDDMYAQFNLGYCYITGKGVEKNIEKAYVWLVKSAEKGYSVAQNFLVESEDLDTINDIDSAYKWYRSAAEQGHAKSQYMTGAFHEEAIGCEKDLKLTAMWFHKAAEQTTVPECKMLSNQFYLEWFYPNYESGIIFAQNRLCDLYKKGTVVKKDIKKAFYWISLASRKTTNYFIKARMGEFYRDGLGCNKDYQLSIKFYHEALELECNYQHIRAEYVYNIGICYLKGGYGVEKDTKTAFAYIKIACDLGYIPASDLLNEDHTRFKNFTEKLNGLGGEVVDAAKDVAKATTIKAIGEIVGGIVGENVGDAINESVGEVASEISGEYAEKIAEKGFDKLKKKKL